MSKTIECEILKQYKLIRKMGSGAYGHVFEVKDVKSNKTYALKKVFDAFRNSIDAQRTYRQVEILHQLHHPNIVALHRVYKSKNNKDLYLVFEFMEADLHSIVGTSILEKIHRIYVFYQIFKAIRYVHSAELIHRDLKPSNVLINSECEAKVCDFGLVRSLASEEREEVVLSEEVATKWYRAPELLLGSRSYGKPVDVWSIGCIIAQILVGKPMFAGDSTINQFEKILQYTGQPTKQDIQSLDSPIAQQLLSQIKVKQKSFREFFSGIDEDFYPLLTHTLKFNPNQRISVQEALELPIFRQFNTQSIPLAPKPIIPTIDDNIRLTTKIYREKIYEDIEQRYKNSLHIKRRVEKKSYSLSKASKQRTISTKKRCISSTKKIQYSQSKNLFKPSVKDHRKTHSRPKPQHTKLNSLLYQHKTEELIRKPHTPPVSHHQFSTYTTTNNPKLLKKGCKKKLEEIDKKQILKRMGIEKNKMFHKYIA